MFCTNWAEKNLAHSAEEFESSTNLIEKLLQHSNETVIVITKYDFFQQRII